MPSMFNRPAKDDLVALLNERAGTAFTSAQVTFTNPKPTASNESVLNTKVRVTVLDTTPNYTGSVVLYYDRLNLASFDLPWALYLSFMAVVDAPLSTLLDKVRDTLGVVFTMDDLEESQVKDDGNGNLSLLLKAKTTSLGWTGQFTLPLKAFPNIATAFSGDSMSAY